MVSAVAGEIRSTSPAVFVQRIAEGGGLVEISEAERDWGSAKGCLKGVG